jgi:hypothetical protein
MSNDYVQTASVDVRFTEDGKALEAHNLKLNTPSTLGVTNSTATPLQIDPVHASSSVAKIEADIAEFETRANEHTFDPRTGEKVFTRDASERARLTKHASMLRSLQLPQARNTLARAEQQQAERIAAERAKQTQEARDARAIAAATAESPELGRFLKEELHRQRARQIAKSIVGGGQ